MKNVDRGNYVSKNPYSDAPQSIGYGVTISAPHMVRRLIDTIVAFVSDQWDYQLCNFSDLSSSTRTH